VAAFSASFHISVAALWKYTRSITLKIGMLLNMNVAKGSFKSQNSYPAMLCVRNFLCGSPKFYCMPINFKF
jgi:hypothetical protein